VIDTSRCPACGSELRPDSPAGLCPDCLLKQGLDSNAAGKGTGESPFDPTRLSPHIRFSRNICHATL
jgi:hypothetical protein